jgi:hypothetical protein
MLCDATFCRSTQNIASSLKIRSALEWYHRIGQGKEMQYTLQYVFDFLILSWIFKEISSFLTNSI